MNYAPELTGIGKYTGEMAEWLAARGHEIRVVTAHPYYPAWKVQQEFRGRGYVRECSASGSVVTRCPLYVPRNATGGRRILHLLSFALSGTPAMLREICSAPDVIWTVEPTFFCLPIALAAGKIANAPVWLHVQDLEVHAAFNLGLLPASGKLREMALRLDRVVTRAFDRVSTISGRMLHRSIREGIPRERALLFPNWVDVRSIVPQPPGTPNSLRTELRLADKVVFLYSGNMGNKQGLELLLPLISALRDDASVHFVLCGDGTFRPAIADAVAGMNNVTLLPLQPLERLNELLNLADVHLLPQRADAADLVMPSKLTGMFASGRPVLATVTAETQVGLFLSGGGEPCGLLVPPGDFNALLHAARTLACDTAMRQNMGRAAREHAERYLSRDHVLRQFERDLEEMVGEFRGAKLPAVESAAG